MSDYGLTDLCTEIGLTGNARSLKYIYDNASTILNKWAKIRPGITSGAKYKGITPVVISSIPSGYAQEWPCDFTPVSDADGPTKILGHFCDLVNNKVYRHSMQAPVTGFEAHEYPQSQSEPLVVYNDDIDLMGNTYIHQFRVSLLNLSLSSAERIGIEDVLGSGAKMAILAVVSGGHEFTKVNAAAIIATGGGEFIIDIAPESWPAGNYTIYPYFVANNQNYSFPSSSVGVGSIEVKAVPQYAFEPLTGVRILEGTAQGADISQQTLHIPFTTGSFQLFGQTMIRTPQEAGAATNTTLTWSSRSPGIISVDANGLCTFVSSGQAIIDLRGRQMAYGELYTEKTNYITLDCSVVLSIAISPTSLEMGVLNNITKTLAASVSPSNAINRRVRYTTNNSSVLVLRNGNTDVTDLTAESDVAVTVKAKAVGTATITATAWGDTSKKATCTVYVRQGATALAITESTLPLYTTSDPVTLHATVSPNNAYNKAITWSSSNTSVATVDANGTVTPRGVGNCTITATTQDTYYSAQQYSDTVAVEVKNPTTTLVSIYIAGYGGAVQVGKSVTLHIMAVYADGHEADVSYANGWSGFNTYFNISGTGTFTAKAEGTCTITASYGGFTSSITATTFIKHVTGVTLNKSSQSIYIGNTFQLTATVSPSDANNKAVTWSSSNTSVATVNSSGLVTGVGVGDATITVTTADGGYTATCAATIMAIRVTGVTLNQSGLTVEIGNTYQLLATVSPSDATNKAVTWSSSNTSVATVSSNGLVTAKATGSATITVTTADGGYTATCGVAVPAPAPVVNGIVIRGYSGAIDINESFTLVVHLTYSDGTEGSENIATANMWSGYSNYFNISGTGTFTAKAFGSCTITATYSGYTASITATVSVHLLSLSISGPSTAVVDSEFTLALYARYSDGSSVRVTSGHSWSGYSTIATRSGDTFTATRSGSATIVGSYGGMTASWPMTISKKLLSIYASPTSARVAIGESFTITIYATYYDGLNYEDTNVTSSVTWSNYSTILTRSGNTFTGKAAGSAFVRAEYGGRAANIGTTVTGAPTVKIYQNGVDVTGSIVDVINGTPIDLAAQVSGVTVSQYRWASSNNGVVRITNASGATCVASYRSDGTVTITLTINGDSSLTASVTARASGDPI